MAELVKDGDDLVVVLSTAEKAESVHGDIRVPVSSVRSVEVIENARHAVPWLKAIGSSVPGMFSMGTFVSKSGTKVFAVVHHAAPRGVRVCLEDGPYDEVVVSSKDPEELVARFSRAG